MAVNSLDRHIIDAREYLRAVGVLNSRPLFQRYKQGEKFIDNDRAYELKHADDPTLVDYHRAEFERIDRQFERISYDDVQERALKEIPDSPDVTIVELGSGYGNKGAGYLASKKPRTKVILTSRREQEEQPYWLFDRNHPFYRNMRHVLVFHEGRELLQDPLTEEGVNDLYRKNGIRNVTFRSYELTSGNITDFAYGIGQRGRIYIFSHRSPKELPFLAGELYNELGALQITVSPTALEKILPDSFVWQVVRKNLGLTENEARGFRASTYQPGMTPLYCYDNNGRGEEQKRVGVMIKFGIALSLAREVSGHVFRNTKLNVNGWNQVDHYVRAQR